MKLYNRISICLSAVFLLVCLVTWRWALLNGAAMHDGGGPDPIFILVLLLMWLAGIALVHSTLIGLVLLARGKGRATEVKESLWGNGILWLVVLAVWAWPKLYTGYNNFQYDQRATSKTFADISNGSSLADFEEHYAQALAEHPDNSFVGAVKSSAALEPRLDIMKSLKSHGVAFAAPGDENSWISSVRNAVQSYSSDSTLRLQAVQWLLDEGASFSYSLQSRSVEFSDPLLYQTNTYKDLSDPATQQLQSLLMAHGVDINACDNNGADCPLWYTAGFGNVAAVKYLIAHGAQLNKTDPTDGSTALGRAISRSEPDIVKILLDAGAGITQSKDRNDIVQACYGGPEAISGKAVQVLELLRDAHVRVDAENLAKYIANGRVLEGEMAACVKGFM